MPDGSRIKPPENHYELDTTHFGIENWANAIFLSPSILYAGHPCYAERIVTDGTEGRIQWCVLISVLSKPGTYTEHPSTVVKSDPVPGEPDDPEWRIDCKGDDVIMRQDRASNVIVTGVVFIRLSFLDDIGDGNDITYERATRLLQEGLSN